MLARRALAVVIGLATTVTVPHLVPARDYGLAAIAAVIFGLAETFKDFGLTSALMRKGEVAPEEVNFLFWFNGATTIVLGAVIAAAAPLSSLFFHEPMVAPVLLVSLIGFVAGGLTLQHRSLLTRDLKFQTLAAIDALALLVQFAVTLSLALATHNVWAIVAGNVVASLLGGLLCVAASRWRPGAPRWLPQGRSLFAFGAHASVYSLSVFAANNVAALLVGRVFGAAVLGQYNRATALQTLPSSNVIGPLAQAVLPVLARLRPMPDLYRKTYLDLVRNLNLIALPMAVLLFVAARPLATAVLGARWGEAGGILQALAPAVAALGFGYAVSDLYITQNRARELGLLGLFELAVRGLSMLAVARWGAVAIAAAFSASTLLVVAVRITVAGRSGPVSLGDHLGAAAPALPLALGALVGAMAGAAAARRFGWPDLAATAAIGGLGLAMSAIFGLAAPASRRAMIDMVGTVSGSAGRLSAQPEA